jgi:hypothetical protein
MAGAAHSADAAHASSNGKNVDRFKVLTEAKKKLRYCERRTAPRCRAASQ